MEKIKKPMLKAIMILAGRYPEPTRENTIHHNTRILLDIQDKFFKYENNPYIAKPKSGGAPFLGREDLFRAAFKILIVEYEHDPYYQYRFDWILEEINKSDWEPRKIRREQCWKEPVIQRHGRYTLKEKHV
jgi:hypothetical protein